VTVGGYEVADQDLERREREARERAERQVREAEERRRREDERLRKRAEDDDWDPRKKEQRER
jgi:hypothetical protein